MKCAVCNTDQWYVSERIVNDRTVMVCQVCIFLLEGRSTNEVMDYTLSVGKNIVLEIKDFKVVGAYKRSNNCQIHPKYLEGSAWDVIGRITLIEWCCLECGFTVMKPIKLQPAGQVNNHVFCERCWSAYKQQPVRVCSLCHKPLTECRC
jgi:hypothetical protein